MANKPQGVVRKVRVAPPRATRPDRRVVRTQRALGRALVDLMVARDFRDISVRQLLERAKVGRATFYAHFRNKQDLLLSDTERFWALFEEHFLARAAGSMRVAPVRELFAHVADYHAFQHSLTRSGMHEPVYDLLLGHTARLIERRVAELRPGAAMTARWRTVTARVLAAALFEMMRWWLDHGCQPSAQEMDDRFHEIVWNGVARASG